jgi:hypothetical protein
MWRKNIELVCKITFLFYKNINIKTYLNKNSDNKEATLLNPFPISLHYTDITYIMKKLQFLAHQILKKIVKNIQSYHT